MNQVLFPIALSLAGFDYSVLQTRALLAIVHHLKPILCRTMNRSSLLHHDLFKEGEVSKDGTVSVELRAVEITGKNHSTRLAEALDELTWHKLSVPYKRDGRCYLWTIPLAQKVTTSRGTVTVELDAKLVMLLARRDYGYQMVNPEALWRCTTRYAQHLYLLMEAVAVNGSYVVPVRRLVDMLQVPPSYYKARNLMNKVIRPAEAQLAKLYDEKLAEVWMHSVLRTDGTISLNMEQGQQELTEAQREQLYTLLTRHCGFPDKLARKVAEAVKPRLYDKVLATLLRVIQHLRTDLSIRNKVGYTLAAMTASEAKS